MNLSSKKSVTLFSNNFWTLYKFREDVVKLLLKRNYRVNLIGKFDGFEQRFIDKDVIKYNLNVDERGYNPFKELILFIRILLLYKKLSSDIYFHFTIKPNIYGSLSASLLNYKYISFITGLGLIFIRGNSMLKKLIIFIYRLSLMKANEIWFTNKIDQSEFIKYKIVSSSQALKIVPGCGVLTSMTYNGKRKYNMKKILMIARLQIEKGVNEYFKLAQKYSELDYTFTIVGLYNNNDPSKISFTSFQKLIKDNVIQHIPFVSNVNSLYDSADCFILPSYREGLSTVLVEAALRKLPIITTRVPGCIDIIPDESFGFLCHHSDISSLDDAFLRYRETSSYDLEIMTTKTQEHVLKNFNRDIIINAYSHKIDEIDSKIS